MTDYKGTRNIWKGYNAIMAGAIREHGDAIVMHIKELKPKKIANNTVRYHIKMMVVANGNNGSRGTIEVVRLHDTEIVKKFPNGDIELNSGGWLTLTTKERMNRVAEGNYSIWQRDRRWILGIPTDRNYYSGRCWECSYREKPDPVPASETEPIHWDSPARECPKCKKNSFHGYWYQYYDEFPFYDGITIRNGTVLDPREEDPRIGKLEKLINRYCDKIGKLSSIPIPDNGDCWYCLGETRLSPSMNKAEYGVLHEDGTLEKKDWEATHCLESHLEELYIHGSLIYNALAFVGYRDPAFILQFGNTSMVRRAVRKYFRSKLGLVR